jgi:hypothetical protein
MATPDDIDGRLRRDPTAWSRGQPLGRVRIAVEVDGRGPNDVLLYDHSQPELVTTSRALHVSLRVVVASRRPEAGSSNTPASPFEPIADPVLPQISKAEPEPRSYISLIQAPWTGRSRQQVVVEAHRAAVSLSMCAGGVRTTIPIGVSSWPVTVSGSYSACGQDRQDASHPPCTKDGHVPALPPGDYRAKLLQSPADLVPAPPEIDIRVTP